MYATVDRVISGTLFWDCISSNFPMPFLFSESDSLVLLSRAKEYALWVVRTEDAVLPGRIVVQLHDNVDEAPLLAVTLSSGFAFLKGESNGNAVDEIAAADVLQYFVPFLLDGEWVQCDDVPAQEDDEDA